MIASAGNRTPINCLEGNYANHYTTDALMFSLIPFERDCDISRELQENQTYHFTTEALNNDRAFYFGTSSILFTYCCSSKEDQIIFGHAATFLIKYIRSLKAFFSTNHNCRLSKISFHPILLFSSLP